MRDKAVDVVRGAAVVLMLVDHVLLMIDPANVLRLTLTRAALPLFMIASGWVLRDKDLPSLPRYVQLMAAAFVATLLVAMMPEFASVNILVVHACCLAVWSVARRWPVGSLAVCFVALATVPRVWDGYHPALCLGLMLVGRVAWSERSGLRRLAEWLPSWLAVVGRRPITIYLGHLAVIYLVGRLSDVAH